MILLLLILGESPQMPMKVQDCEILEFNVFNAETSPSLQVVAWDYEFCHGRTEPERLQAHEISVTRWYKVVESPQRPVWNAIEKRWVWFLYQGDGIWRITAKHFLETRTRGDPELMHRQGMLFWGHRTKEKKPRMVLR